MIKRYGVKYTPYTWAKQIVLERGTSCLEFWGEQFEDVSVNMTEKERDAVNSHIEKIIQRVAKTLNVDTWHY